MDSINNDIMQQAAEHVIRANRLADIHTVTLELNGGHGGVDLVVSGTIGKGRDYDDFEQKVVLR